MQARFCVDLATMAIKMSAPAYPTKSNALSGDRFGLRGAKLERPLLIFVTVSNWHQAGYHVRWLTGCELRLLKLPLAKDGNRCLCKFFHRQRSTKPLRANLTE